MPIAGIGETRGGDSSVSQSRLVAGEIRMSDCRAKVAVFGRQGVGTHPRLLTHIRPSRFFLSLTLLHLFHLSDSFYQLDLTSPSWRLSLLDMKGLASLLT